MKDNIVVIRPPSEAESFLLPVTIGCSHNKCTFCNGYIGTDFRLRAWEHIREHIDIVAGRYAPAVRRVFLENGDALVAPGDGHEAAVQPVQQPPRRIRSAQVDIDARGRQQMAEVGLDPGD